jgi:hypothetical protein
MLTQYSDFDETIIVLKFAFYFVFTFLVFSIFTMSVYFENQCVSVTVIKKVGKIWSSLRQNYPEEIE